MVQETPEGPPAGVPPGDWMYGSSRARLSPHPAGGPQFSPAGVLSTRVPPDPGHRLRARAHETPPLQPPITYPSRHWCS